MPVLPELFGLRKMETKQLGRDFQEVYQIFNPEKFFVLIDLHNQTDYLFCPLLCGFLK